jgi:hypothetical protein
VIEPCEWPGSRLHVDLRISGRGSVRQRGVAEVVEGAERLLDLGPRQRGLEVSPRKLARLERRPLRRMAEDEIVVAAIGRAAPLVLKDSKRPRAELDDPA